ncbi:MAG: CoA-binding protein [Erysipelotrichaceae bacterium]
MLRNEELLRTMKRWAILGLNENPQGYANLIYDRLLKRGKTVAGVNAMYSQLPGKEVYTSLHKLPFKPDVVVSVVRPEVGLFYLEEMRNYGMKILWLQPGTVDENLLKRAQEFKIETLQACVLVSLDFVEHIDDRE